MDCKLIQIGVPALSSSSALHRPRSNHNSPLTMITSFVHFMPKPKAIPEPFLRTSSIYGFAAIVSLPLTLELNPEKKES
jgi:hypothetical protein